MSSSALIKKPFIINALVVYEDNTYPKEPVDYEIINLNSGEIKKGTTNKIITSSFSDVIHGEKNDLVNITIKAGKYIETATQKLTQDKNKIMFIIPKHSNFNSQLKSISTILLYLMIPFIIMFTLAIKLKKK